MHNLLNTNCMNRSVKSFLFTAALIGSTSLATAQQATTASLWLTKADRSALFEKQKESLAFKPAAKNENFTIAVNDKQTYQPIDGFGFALTGGSAMHIIRMSADSRAALLKNLLL
jgi:glucosylceramidase